MANFDVTIGLKDFKGKPIESSGSICPTCNHPIEAMTMTLRDVLLNSLNAEVEGEKIEGREKFRRFKLAMRISEHDSASLSADEITLLKGQVAKFYRALVVGQVWELLDPEVPSS
jgi:hypothetical protein